MLNRKKACMLLGITLLAGSFVIAGCGKKNKEKEEIISSELIDEENITVGTSKVERGTFSNEVTVSAEKIYGKTAELAFPFNEVEIEGVYVKTGDTIKKGDLVAKLKAPSQERLDNYAKSIQNERDTYQSVVASYDNRIQEKSGEASAASGAQKEVAQAELSRLRIEREQYVYTMEKAVQEMEAEYEKMKNVNGQESLYAPFDGIVQSVYEAGEGNTVSSGATIATIYSADDILFSFKNDKKFRYGMEVTIEAGVGEERQTFKGKVVAADNIMFDDYHTNKAYVAATEEFNPKNLQNIYISGEIMHLENVLTADSLSVMEAQEKYGVSIEMDGGAKYRHITLGALGNGKAWILQGVEEGQTLTIE